MDEMKKHVCAHRYEKICESIAKEVNELAEDYEMREGKTRMEFEDGQANVYEIKESQLHREAIKYGCQEVLERIEDIFGSEEIYWVTELILEDEFEYDVSPQNPYRKKQHEMLKYRAEMSVMGIPVIKLEA